MSSRRRPFAASTLVWVVLAIVFAGALVVAASPGSARQSPAQRAAALDAVLKCPSCETISVADSSASTAVAIRQLVASRVRAGQSDAQIEGYLVSRYGPSILLRPPATGLTAVVWVVPVLVAMVGIGGLAVLFWRRRRVAPVRITQEDRALVAQALAQASAAGGQGAVPGT